jgi:hypothetical protein
MFIADVLEVFGFSLAQSMEALWPEDFPTRLTRRVKEVEQKLRRLRARLIRCQRAIERLRARLASVERMGSLQSFGNSPRFGACYPRYGGAHSSLERRSALLRARLEHVQDRYTRTILRVLGTKQRLASLQRQLKSARSTKLQATFR